MPAVELARGDELWIAPGDLVPVDGVLLRRQAEVALDWITGESERMRYEPGQVVPAGAFNAGARLRVTATEDFATSRLQRAAARAGDGRRGGVPARLWWHRVSTIYVVAVLAAAALGLLIWLPRDAERALPVAIAVLVITCPCALGLATPLAEELTQRLLRRAACCCAPATSWRRPCRCASRLRQDRHPDPRRADDDRPVPARLDALRSDRARLLRSMTARSNHPVSKAIAAGLAGDADAAGRPAARGRRRRARWPGPASRLADGCASDAPRDAPSSPATGPAQRHGRSPATARSLAGLLVEERLRRRGQEVGRAARATATESAPAERRRDGKVAGHGRRLDLRPDHALVTGGLDPEAKADPRARPGRARHADGRRRPQRRAQLRGGALRGDARGRPSGAAGQGRLLLLRRRSGGPALVAGQAARRLRRACSATTWCFAAALQPGRGRAGAGRPGHARWWRPSSCRSARWPWSA